MLNYENYIKTYKFDYGYKMKKVLSISFELLINLSIVFLYLPFFLSVNFLLFGDSNSVIKRIFLIAEVVIFVFLLIYMPLLVFLPKRAILYQNSINVKRNNISSKGFNDNILYSSIISCALYKGGHYRGRGGPEYAIILFDWDSLVEIVCEKNKKYYIPVKDADDFIAEVNARVEKIKFFRALNIDSLLKDKNGKTISYYDLKVRWKSSDKIDSVYYTDDEGNDIDIINY